MDESIKKKKKSKLPTVLLLILSLLLVGAGIFSIVLIYGGRKTDLSVYHVTQPSLTPTPSGKTTPSGNSGGDVDATADTTAPPETTEPDPVFPIDFEALWEINPSIYAWIYIPNTDIDLPILQSEPDEYDSYYLHRNIYKEYEYKGSIYTQRLNSKDFTDPVTVIYGHNMLNGTMFSNLDKFYDQTFFDENAYFYIYTPGHILTYEIVSAHQYDKRHILKSFDFSNEDVFQKYLNMIQAPNTFFYHVRDGITLTTEDRIVTLSTCMNHGTSRYLIQGVLINDEVWED